MNRKGFALIGVLWAVALLSAAVGLGLGAARIGGKAAANRAVLLRGSWAANACLAIAAAWWRTPRWHDTATIELGTEARCSWRAGNPAGGLNVNRASRDLLQRLLDAEGVPSGWADPFLDTVVAARARSPYRSLAELPTIPGYSDRLAQDLTFDGPGTVDANAASRAVLLALPGFGAEAADRVLGERVSGRPVTSLDQLIGLLSPVSQRAITAHYAELASLVVFSPPQLVLTATGWLASYGEPRATIELLVVPLPDRLAVIRRRVS